MRRLKTIDEIYEEVKGYGLVITNDAPLETALNSRISTARIGALAMTPRHIAKLLGPVVLNKGFMSDLEIIANISEETDLGFRHVYSEILNIREIRSHTLDVRSNLTTWNSKRIYDSYVRLPTIEAAMSGFDVEDPRVSEFFERIDRVAVVGVDLFDDLDKHFIPLDADDIDIFTDDEFSIDRIYEVGNDRQIAENAAGLIDPEHADDYAVVLDTTAPIADAMRAALYRRGIHFINSLNVRDLSRVRDFMGFIGLALRYRTARVKDVKELFSVFGGYFRDGRDEFLLNRQGDDTMSDRTRELRDAMSRIEGDGMTFGEARDILFRPLDRSLITMILEELNMEDDIITSGRLNEMRFAVDNIQNLKHNEQIPEEERDGVLLADCKNSVFVDRPVVIYLGMEQEWNVPVVGKRYLDAERESELNALRLSALIQQGQRRVFLVNSNKNGKPARPCLTFDLITGERCESFESIYGELVRGRWVRESEPHMPDRGESDLESVEEFARPFSKSSFNAYASCPRRYMYHELLPTQERTQTEFGNLIHEFAEFYLCYGDEVRSRGIDDFVDMVSERYAGLSTPLMEGLDRQRIRRAMVNVMAYIDTIGATPVLDVRADTRRSPNRFMAALGKEWTSDSCETDHRSEVHPVHGIFDLYWDGIITDYKTGRAMDSDKIVEAMNINKVARFCEFQPLIYLNLAKEAKDPRFVFRQFYAMARDVESSDKDFDIRENVRTVELGRGDLSSVISGETNLVAALESKLKKEYKPRAPHVIAAMAEGCPSDPDRWEGDDELVGRVAAALGPDKDLEYAKKALRDLARICRGGMVAVGNRVIVPFATLQSFISRLDDMHAEMLQGMTTKLPARPNGEVECSGCPYLQVCTAQEESVQEVDSDE